MAGTRAGPGARGTHRDGDEDGGRGEHEDGVEGRHGGGHGAGQEAVQELGVMGGEMRERKATSASRAN